VGFGLAQILRYLRGGYRRIDPRSEQALQAQGILRPRAERRLDALHTHVNRLELILSGLLGLISVGLIYTGDGDHWTWVGVGLFLVILIWFTYLSTQGIFEKTKQERP
jgi:hypothetical protein